MRIRERFNPRAPCGARRSVPALSTSDFLISTHAPLAGRDTTIRIFDLLILISTHAPLAGRDHALGATSWGGGAISTHAPLAGRDFGSLVYFNRKYSFQPTRPLRGATVTLPTIVAIVTISTHAPLAGRDGAGEKEGRTINISTHAPLAGRDCAATTRRGRAITFQPTRPARGATHFADG